MTSAFFNQKLRFFRIHFPTVNSTKFNTKENSTFFQYRKREKNYPAFDCLCRTWEDLFPNQIILLYNLYTNANEYLAQWHVM
jgi:hypothetical protein